VLVTPAGVDSQPDVRGSHSSNVQTLMIEPATAESGHALYNALWSFHPEFTEDETGRALVSVCLRDDSQVLEVFDAIEKFLAERRPDPAPTSIDLSLNGRRYRIVDS